MKFEKITIEQFEKDLGESYGLDNAYLKQDYEDLKLPKRATRHSAGYDFFAPYDITIKPGEAVKIPTGIKCELDFNKVLFIAPRSSLGFKYGAKLANTIGVIDCDYYNNVGNEGHIFIKIVNEGLNGQEKSILIKKGEAFAQGIILPYFITENDDTIEDRVGGLGSTNVNR